MTRTALTRTVVAVKDLADQTEATYYVTTAGNWLGVESWNVLKSGAVEFFDGEGRTVLLLSPRTPFILLRHDQLELMSSEEAARQMHADHEELAILRKELHPGDDDGGGGAHPSGPAVLRGYL